jgi:hypothetical protein
MKNLKKLQKDGLLKSKSYGLGHEILWGLKKSRLLDDLGFTAPRSEVHSSKYEHEKVASSIFGALALSGQLYEWQGEGDQKMGLRPDRAFRISDPLCYLEVEMGSQKTKRLQQKLDRYIRYYHSQKGQEGFEPFYVLFAVKTEADIDTLVELFTDNHLGNHYFAALQSDLISDALNAPVTSRFARSTLSKHLSNHVTSE